MTEQSKKLTFRVQSCSLIPNPYSHLDFGDHNAKMYIAICDVKNLPDDIPMETNPREQKMTTGVVKKITQSLLDISEMDFYLLNRGLLLSAKEVRYNTYSKELTIIFEDLEVHGDVDGGHTYKTILQNREQLDYDQQYVKLEILVGVEGIFQALAAARNTSVQVQDKSIAELEDRFDLIKNTLKNEKYFDRIYYKENDSGDIDVSDILAVLNLFNIDQYNGMNSFPISSYSSKKKCIDLYINNHKTYGESENNPYAKMKPIMTDIFKLYDEIEVNMNRYYRVKNPSGRYGATKGVQIPKPGQSFCSKYYKQEMDVMSPNGFIYPILGAFRALVVENEGRYMWKCNPFSVLSNVGPELVESTVSQSRALGNNPQSVGKDINIWKTLYMTVAFAVREERL